MKIDAELRQAIRSVAETAKRQVYNRAAREEARQASIDTYMTTKKAAPVRAALVAYTKAKKAEAAAEVEAEKADAIANKHGLHFSQYRTEKPRVALNNDSDFVRAGGKLPPQYTDGWDANQVIAELAAALEKDKMEILKKYGILWE